MRCLFQLEEPFFRLDNIHCAFSNFSSNSQNHLGFSYIVRSEQTSISFMTTSISVEYSVLGIVFTSVSARMETKYLPLGFRLIVALRIRPSTSRLFAKRTRPSLGNFILLSAMAMLPFVCFVV